MTTVTKRYRLHVDDAFERALRHAAVARETTPAGVLQAAATELLKRDGWIQTTDGDERLPPTADR